MKKPYNIVYVLIMFLTSVYILFFHDESDGVLMMLAAIMIILTSIFTYSNRKR